MYSLLKVQTGVYKNNWFIFCFLTPLLLILPIPTLHFIEMLVWGYGDAYHPDK